MDRLVHESMVYKGIHRFHFLITTCLCMLVCFAQLVFFSNKVICSVFACLVCHFVLVSEIH